MSVNMESEQVAVVVVSALYCTETRKREISSDVDEQLVGEKPEQGQSVLQ